MEDFADTSPRNSPIQEETSPMATKSKPVGKWTDEKHGLFLKSMESMFVSQLYNSIDAFGWHTHKNHTLLSKRDSHGVEHKDESTNPWIQHCRNSSIRKTRKVQASHARAPSGRNFKPVHRDSVGSNTEAMDQNFNNEGSEGDEPRTRRIHGMKRTESCSDVGSSTNQVVPIYNKVEANNGA